MNSRRSFLSSMLNAGVACAFLPAATMFKRTWKRTNAGVWASDWGLISAAAFVELNVFYFMNPDGVPFAYHIHSNGEVSVEKVTLFGQ